MKNFKSIIKTTAALLMAAMMAGCGAGVAETQVQTTAPTSAENGTDISRAAGVVLLSVNPEIEIEYDRRGLVLDVEGVNDDGREIVKSLTDLKGKSAEQVVEALVREICDGGYFSEKVMGKDKNIVVKLEDGSEYPADDFLTDIADGIRTVILEKGLTSGTVTVDKSDLDGEGYIGLQKAKAIVMSQLGIDEATFYDREYEPDDGKYEFEFKAGGIEYEYEVDAISGKILDADTEKSDERNDSHEEHNPLTSAPEDEPAGFITEEEAQRIALEHFGLASDSMDSRSLKLSLDPEDGKYELELYADGVEYDIDIDAYTGAVLDFDVEERESRTPVAATSAPTESEREELPPAGTTSVSSPSEVPEIPQLIGFDRAKEIALSHFGLADAVVTERDCDPEDGEYELELYADGVEYDIDIDAYTGAVLDFDVEERESRAPVAATSAPTESEREELPPAGTTAVSSPSEVPEIPQLIGFDRAKEIALSHFGLADAVVTERDCDLEDGEYELELYADGVEYGIDIDAYTGAVLDFDVEIDD